MMKNYDYIVHKKGEEIKDIDNIQLRDRQKLNWRSMTQNGIGPIMASVYSDAGKLQKDIQKKISIDVYKEGNQMIAVAETEDGLVSKAVCGTSCSVISDIRSLYVSKILADAILSEYCKAREKNKGTGLELSSDVVVNSCASEINLKMPVKTHMSKEESVISLSIFSSGIRVKREKENNEIGGGISAADKQIDKLLKLENKETYIRNNGRYLEWHNSYTSILTKVLRCCGVSEKEAKKRTRDFEAKASIIEKSVKLEEEKKGQQKLFDDIAEEVGKVDPAISMVRRNKNYNTDSFVLSKSGDRAMNLKVEGISTGYELYNLDVDVHMQCNSAIDLHKVIGVISDVGMKYYKEKNKKQDIQQENDKGFDI